MAPDPTRTEPDVEKVLDVLAEAREKRLEAEAEEARRQREEAQRREAERLEAEDKQRRRMAALAEYARDHDHIVFPGRIHGDVPSQLAAAAGAYVTLIELNMISAEQAYDTLRTKFPRTASEAITEALATAETYLRGDVR